MRKDKIVKKLEKQRAKRISLYILEDNDRDNVFRKWSIADELTYEYLISGCFFGKQNLIVKSSK